MDRVSIRVAKSRLEEHYCSFECEENKRPCDLCMAQRRTQQDARLRAENKPTLHTTLGDLLKRKA